MCRLYWRMQWWRFNQKETWLKVRKKATEDKCELNEQVEQNEKLPISLILIRYSLLQRLR
jgi:hypothetical protein